MKSFALIIFLTITGSVFGQTITVKQLYDEYRKNRSAFENKYRNQLITVTGKIRSISPASSFWKDQDVHRIHLTATGYENFVVCQIPYRDSAIVNQFKVGNFVTVKGMATSVSDAVYLSQCTFGAAQPIATKSLAPTDAPLGRYDVYQNDGQGFNFQYSLNLKSYNTYILNGQSGTCNYSIQTKVIKFLSGPLKGFAGLYRPFTDNEKDPPGFLLDATGKIPDPNGSHRGYQFGYFHK